MTKPDKTKKGNEKCRNCDKWDKDTGYCDATGTIKKNYQHCRWFDWKEEDHAKNN